MKRKSKTSINRDAWLATYGDMITLILVFFVLLYSMSSIDQQKYKLLVKAFTADPETLEQISMEESAVEEGNLDAAVSGGENVELEDIQDLEDLYKYLVDYVEENNLQHSVYVAITDNLVYVRFASSLFFEPDRAVLKEGGRTILDHVGQALSVVEPSIKNIRIDGHTAESAPGDESVNDRDLSTERANEVLKFLEGTYIDDPAKLYAVGYGRYRPVASNDTEVNRAKNRRVEILVSKADTMQDTLDQIYEDEKKNAQDQEQ